MGDNGVGEVSASTETSVDSVPEALGTGGGASAESGFPRPGVLDEVDDGTGVSVPEFRAATERIARIIEERTKPLSRGFETPMGREMPKWKGAKDLRDAASKPINWAVKNLWTQRAKLLLAAEQKTGKTFIICHIAMCVSTGMPLFGCERFQVLDKGPVGVVAGEDDEGEVGRRLDRMFRASGALLSEAPIHFLPAHNIRLNRERDQEFIRKSVRELGLRLVVYDPLARLMDGDENSKEAVSSVLNPASALAKDEDVSVLVVHHLGKQNTESPRTAIARVRGSSDITSWFSCGLFISGQMRLGRLQVEVVQRTSGDVPNEFSVAVREDQAQSVYGLGAMRMVAELDEDRHARAGRNEQLVEEAAEAIWDLVRRKGHTGVSMSEISVHLGFGRGLVGAAVKRLIREQGLVRYDTVDDMPDRKLLFPVGNGHRPAPTPGPDSVEDDEFGPGPGQLDLY